MAKYTIELRNVCNIYTREVVESWFKDWNFNDYLTEDEINTINQKGVFSKDKLAKQIVDTYYMREIGQETPALFKLYAHNKMQEIMEEYAPLIYSSSIQYDPLVNVDYTETFQRDINRANEGSATSNTNNNSSGITVNSDTPQGQISKENVLNGAYASSVNAGESVSQTSDNTNSTSTENTGETYTKNIRGNSGVSATAQAMIKQYRQNIRAINKEIIDRLNTLFIGLY